MRFKNISRNFSFIKKLFKTIKNNFIQILHNHLMGQYQTINKTSQVQEKKNYSNYLYNCMKSIKQYLDSVLRYQNLKLSMELKTGGNIK